jgi:hypothetical protein
LWLVVVDIDILGNIYSPDICMLLV